MHLVKVHIKLNIDNLLCSHIIRPAAKCLGEETPLDGELDLFWVRLLDRPVKPKQVLRVNRECLAEAPVYEIFNSHLMVSFSSSRKVVDMESEWTMSMSPALTEALWLKKEGF